MEKSFEKSQTNFIGRTLLTMSTGLLVTFIVSMLISNTKMVLNPYIMIVSFIAEIGIVFYLSSRIAKMSPGVARMWFYTYAALNGVTFSLIFLSYAAGTIGLVFLLSSAMFFCSAMVGMTTKVDMSAFGRFFMMAVIGLMLLMLAQVLFGLSGMDMLISLVGIGVFSGLTAYDMQKIKNIHRDCYNLSPEETGRYTIISALRLYLDFINIFLFTLRMFRGR
ncbi:MAG TPA: Bax inhibitor-1/YccA family protein [Clostridiaceae bacterium]